MGNTSTAHENQNIFDGLQLGGVPQVQEAINPSVGPTNAVSSKRAWRTANPMEYYASMNSAQRRAADNRHRTLLKLASRPLYMNTFTTFISCVVVLVLMESPENTQKIYWNYGLIVSMLVCRAVHCKMHWICVTETLKLDEKAVVIAENWSQARFFFFEAAGTCALCGLFTLRLLLLEVPNFQYQIFVFVASIATVNGLGAMLFRNLLARYFKEIKKTQQFNEEFRNKILAGIPFL